MKTNAPEKLYIDFRDRAESTWRCAYTEKTMTTDIEYVRADAFVERAEKYLTEKFIKDVSVLTGGVVSINFSTAIKNFVKYMEGK